MADDTAGYGDPVTRPFWEAAARHELLVQRCTGCGHAQLYPRVLCTACGATGLTWEGASGRGTVVAATESYLPAHPTLAPPYTVALIALDEGPRVLGNPAGATSGDRVVLIWEAREGAPPLPQWRRAADGAP